MILGENVLNEALSLLLFRTTFEDYQKGPGKDDLDHVTGMCVFLILLKGDCTHVCVCVP